MEERKLGRRRFLLTGAAAGAALGAAYVGGWWYYRVRTGDTRGLVLSVLHRHLRHLQVEERDLKSFAEAMHERFSSQRRLAWMGMLGGVYEFVNIYNLVPQTRRGFRGFEDAIVSDFLLSTDFFDNGADDSQPLVYRHAHDPYERICANPFASFD